MTENDPTKSRHVLVLAVDGFHAAFSGPYGNSWITTPGLDRFACEAALFDRYYANTLDLSLLYREFWYGLHPKNAPAEPTVPGFRSLPETLKERGYRTILVSDDPGIAYNFYAEGFSETHLLELPQSDAPAESLEQTQFYRMFATILDLLSSRDSRDEKAQPIFLWAHFRAFTGTWDFPDDYRQEYVEEDDPPPYRETTPPCYDYLSRPESEENAEPDPDELRSVVEAYSGGVTAFDEAFEAFYDSFQESKLDPETLLVLLGTRGFSLGEHRFIGSVEEAEKHSASGLSPLWGENLQLPFLLRFPKKSEPLLSNAGMFRSFALTQPNDLHATLRQYLGLEDESETQIEPEPFRGVSLLPILRLERDATRERLVILGEHEDVAIVSPDWFYRRTHCEELFAKPGDRYEFNEVADRCEEVVEQFRGLLNTPFPDRVTF